MTARTDTRRKVVDLAERFVMERGYHAFSFRDVADELGVQPPAVHYHFRTKAELVVEVLDRYVARFERWGATVADRPPAEQLAAYVALSRGLLAEGRIDPFGTLAGEHDHLPPEIQDRLRKLQAAIVGWFAALLEGGRASGAFCYAGAPRARAAEVVCALLGAQQVGRVCGAEAFEEVAGQIVASLNS